MTFFKIKIKSGIQGHILVSIIVHIVKLYIYCTVKKTKTSYVLKI